MQQPGGDDEAEAVEQGTRALGQFAAVRVTVEDREESDDERRRATAVAGPLPATIAPSTIADSAMPISTPGSGKPSRPISPPNAITSGNATGSTQIAGAPSTAPHRPTATIASTWSSPDTGWASPARNPAAWPLFFVRERDRRQQCEERNAHQQRSARRVLDSSCDALAAESPRAESSRTHRACPPGNRAAVRRSAASAISSSRNARSSNRISTTNAS